MYGSISFDKYVASCSHYHSKAVEYFCHSKKFPHVPLRLISFLHPSCCFACHYSFASSRRLYKWNIQYVDSCDGRFSLCITLLSHPCGCMYQWLISFYSWAVFHWMETFQIAFRLISGWIPLWRENICYMISILSNVLRSVVWPQVWANLVKVPRAVENLVFSVVVGWSVL